MSKATFGQFRRPERSTEAARHAEVNRERAIRAETVCAQLRKIEPPHHREIPEAIRGIDGINKAHEILKEQKKLGLLIGGLSEAVYDPDYTSEMLSNRHKDVDIMIFQSTFKPKQFEGGIDWWLPHNVEETFVDTYGHERKIRSTYWKSGHGVILPFALVSQGWNGTDGLIIPSIQTVLDMREIELYRKIKEEQLELGEEYSEYDVEAGFRRWREQQYERLTGNDILKESIHASWSQLGIRPLTEREEAITQNLGVRR